MSGKRVLSIQIDRYLQMKVFPLASCSPLTRTVQYRTSYLRGLHLGSLYVYEGVEQIGGRNAITQGFNCLH